MQVKSLVPSLAHSKRELLLLPILYQSIENTTMVTFHVWRLSQLPYVVEKTVLTVFWCPWPPCVLKSPEEPFKNTEACTLPSRNSTSVGGAQLSLIFIPQMFLMYSQS